MPWSKEKQKAYMKVYRQKNREKIYALQRRWESEHREQARSWSRKWRATHPEARKEVVARYRTNHLDAVRTNAVIQMAKRRAIVASSNTVTVTQVQELVALYRGLCAYCAVPCKPTLDHVVPLSRGGKHEIGNLLPVCFKCNRSKGVKTLDEWLGKAA